MYEIERQEKIVEILRKKKSCSVAELAKILSFSEATIRRDLRELDRQMKVKKTFGGAVIREYYTSEVPMEIRSLENASVKDRLGRAAAEQIKDHMTVFLDASTTVESLLPYIKERVGLVVITNHPDIPSRLSGTNIAVYSTGGKFLHHSNAYVGELARKIIRSINVDLAVFSVRGLDGTGKMTTFSTDDDIYEAMMESASRTCLVIDSSKFDKTYTFTVGHIQTVDTVITDSPLPDGCAHTDIRIVP